MNRKALLLCYIVWDTILLSAWIINGKNLMLSSSVMVAVVSFTLSPAIIYVLSHPIWNFLVRIFSRSRLRTVKYLFRRKFSPAEVCALFETNEHHLKNLELEGKKTFQKDFFSRKDLILLEDNFFKLSKEK